MVPAEDQAMVLPWTSVMVIIVLLNDAFTCATPEAIFLRSRRRTRVASLPILNPFGAIPAAPVAVTFCQSERVISSCRRSASLAPCGCAHWCASAAHEPADRDDDAAPGSNRDPSAA